MSDNNYYMHEEALRIIMSYYKSGADSMKLAQLYETLMPDKEERSKEEIINKRILSLIAGKELAESKISEKERNVTEDVRRWVDYSTGEWYIGNLYSDLTLKEKKEKDVARHAVGLLVKDGIIENVSKRSGNYRKIQKTFTPMNIEGASGLPIANFRYPLEVEKYAKTYPKSVTTVNGFPNQGKSAFVFEIARMNRNLFPGRKPRFQSSEAGEDEIKEKLMFYPQDQFPIGWWINNIDFIERYDTWWDIIDPDGLNIIDYVSDNLENFKIAYYIKEIHKKLKKGVAIVVLQRDPAKPNSYGGQATRHDTRLAIDIEYKKCVLAKVKGAIKYPPEFRHPDGIARTFELKNVWKLIATGDWYWPDEEKLASYKSKKESKGREPGDDGYIKED